MTQYKYALLRQEPGRLVVDLNVNEKPAKLTRGEETFMYPERIDHWQSSHVTIPVDKGEEDKFKNHALTLYIKNVGQVFKFSLSHAMENGILINPELIEVCCGMPDANGECCKGISACPKSGEQFIFLREEKKEAHPYEKEFGLALKHIPLETYNKLLTDLHNAQLRIKELDAIELPTDKECEDWYILNIAPSCSASSGIYKFRLWLKERKFNQTTH